MSRPPIRRKNIKKGIQFTVMVVGCSGLGRTTFVNTLCDKSVIPYTSEEEDLKDGKMKILPYQVELDEEGVRINLTIVDTPGFGDSINNEQCFKDILEYVEKQYDDILAEESRIKRNPKFKDNRVHVLLYFITPTGHSLRELDIELMRQLGPRVNIIPVIGKADTFTKSELADFKRRVMEDVEHYSIPIYNFPCDPDEDDPESIEENNELRNQLPFAIIASEDDAGHTRVRRYPWGTVEVDNTEHCDFSKLRYALLTSHLNDLKEITHDFLYENYRTEKLSRENPDAEEEEEEEEGEEGGEEGKEREEADVSDSKVVRLREDHLKKEEEQLKDREKRVQKEISEKRKELLAKEEALRTLESRLTSA